ncbi:MAG: His/Gly/Thr/Pro-type tRNA ligase C-terminal domain-containing protein, partial [Chitinivibrionales bacterium]
TVEYLELTDRTERAKIVETCAREMGLFYTGETDDREYTDVLEVDLSTVEPSLAGPARPQDRIVLHKLERNFTNLLDCEEPEPEQEPVSRFLDESGNQKTATMGCYGIGVGRTAAAAIEQNHDKDGIIWPASIAPYGVSLLCLDPADTQVMSTADRLHRSLEEAGIDVILDDRQERPGIKFKDADLIGCPIRIVVGARGLKEGIIEIRRRRTGQADNVDPSRAVGAVVAMLQQL